MNSEGTEPHTYVSTLPQIPPHPGCHMTLNRVPWAVCRSLLVIHFKDSNMYMTFPKSLTILFPRQPQVHFSKSMSLFLEKLGFLIKRWLTWEISVSSKPERKKLTSLCAEMPTWAGEDCQSRYLLPDYWGLDLPQVWRVNKLWLLWFSHLNQPPLLDSRCNSKPSRKVHQQTPLIFLLIQKWTNSS